MSSPLAVRLLSWIARGIPPQIGYPLAGRIGNWIATRGEAKSRAIRLNQWIARGANLKQVVLDQAVAETLRNNVRDIYSLYHFLGDPEATLQIISFSTFAREVLERPEFSDRGLIILGLHLSNFDFVLRPASQNGCRPVVLTFPNPQGGRRVEYEMRKQTSTNIVPVSISALRDAIKHLEHGGIVVTGADHPVAETELQPTKPCSIQSVNLKWIDNIT